MLRIPTSSKSVKPLAKHVRNFTNDLYVNPRTNAPIITYGPGGRSSVSGHVVTVFGCTGFLGRYLVHKLAKAGSQVIIPYRDEDTKRHLKVMGDLGQIVPMEWNAKYTPSIEECVRHSDVVYNLVGRNYETKNFNYTDVHVDAARLIAQVSRDSPKVAKFVHVSHLDASTESESEFYRTKALGEQAVLEEFPEATIVRPGPMYGHEDRLLNSMAARPKLWTLNNASTKIRPVHVLDVAQALANLTPSPPPNFAGTTYNLPGPTIHTYASLLNLISYVTYNRPLIGPNLPKPILMAISKLKQNIWWPTFSPDEIIRQFINDVGTATAEEVRQARRSGSGKTLYSEDWKGDWDAFGITPEEVENVAIIYLRRYRTAINWSRPVVLPPTRGTPEYHVLG